MVLDNQKTMLNSNHVSKILLSAKIERFPFDANNAADRAVYYHFSQTGKWMKHFEFKFPDRSAVAMCQRKLIEYALRNEAATA
jgi:hypothetical protein